MFCAPEELRNAVHTAGPRYLLDELKRMGWEREQLRSILRFQDYALGLLDQLKGLGFPYKRLAHYHFCPFRGTASWAGRQGSEEEGFITIYLGCEPGAVAHELGHGFHERIRKERGLPDEFGEEYAEAIRWFTEQKAGPTDWFNKFKSIGHADKVLVACNYDLRQFQELLKVGKYYPACD